MARLKPIEQKVIVMLTLEEAVEYNRIVDKYWNRKDGIPTEDCNVNKCPNCDTEFTEHSNHCSKCGQWVRFIKCDTLPL